ncbi:hypothetical protein ENBRE01_2122 [Enteropsectra breve]|nr:hypothetical protein ENBRE01_2122 [Enteropsectra breve]
MYSDVEKCISSCENCIKSGNIISNTNNVVIRTSEPGEIVEIDMVGPLPLSFQRNKFIITCIDHHSKLAKIKAVREKLSETIKDFIVNESIPSFPFKISCFLSVVWTRHFVR